MRKPAEKPQQGRRDATPTPICCGIYMNRQTIRKGPEYSKNRPASWLCLKCGKMILDKEAFEKIRIKEENKEEEEKI
jgi:hypothetical protein